MKRTVRLATLPLNNAKEAALASVILSYTGAKRRFVGHLRSPSLWALLDRGRSFRDHAKEQGWYPAGLNVHLVDQAAFDAVDTCVRHIESCLARASIKAKVWRKFTDEDARHYAYACLSRYSALGEIMSGGVPEVPTVTLTPKTRADIASYLHRIIRSAINGTWPSVTQARSMTLDSTLYSVPMVERPGSTPARRQYVRVVGATPRSRIMLPLAGVSRVSGNIRVVLDDDSKRAFIHVAYDIAPLGSATGPPVASDWGITEVCTDDRGARHGTGYGPALVSMTERRNITGKARGKLRAISKKNAGSKRARHVARHNLGTKKQRARLRRSQAQLMTIAGAAIKEVVYGTGNRTRKSGKAHRSSTQRPRSIIVEDLSHLQGKAKSKKVSRVCTSWARSVNIERITVHAYVGGSDVETVNAAYTSQTCPDPTCGYVSSDNRHRDTFHCRNPHWDCTWQGDADHVAAMNIKSRIDDREISRFTPHTEVKKILDERFLRRKGSRNNKGKRAIPSGQRRGIAAGDAGVQAIPIEGTVTAHGRTPSKPRGSVPDVGDSFMVVDSQSPGFVDTPGETQRLESEKKRSA